MASVSSSHLILFIASLLIAASVAGTFTQGVQRLSSALGDRSIDVMQDVRTDIEIISDPQSSAIYNSSGKNNTTVLVKNTGSRTLEAESDRIDVLVNGTYQPKSDVSVTVVDGSVWRVGNVVRVEIDQSLASGEDHRVAVIINNDQEVLRFRT